MEDKENGLRDVPILLQVISLLYRWIKDIFKYQSHQHKMNCNKHFRDILSLFLLNFRGRGLILCLARCIKCMNIFGAYVEY